MALLAGVAGAAGLLLFPSPWGVLGYVAFAVLLLAPALAGGTVATAMAAAVAALLSVAAAWALARWVFEGRFSPQPMPLALLGLGVVGLTVLVGLLNSREVIRRTPLEVLRGE